MNPRNLVIIAVLAAALFAGGFLSDRRSMARTSALPGVEDSVAAPPSQRGAEAATTPLAQPRLTLAEVEAKLPAMPSVWSSKSWEQQRALADGTAPADIPALMALLVCRRPPNRPNWKPDSNRKPACTPRHLALKELPKEQQFPRLRAERKHSVDPIKLIAYRAEKALVGTVREALARADDGRAMVRELMRTPANLQPDLEAKTLTVRLHALPSGLQDAAVRHLAEELAATETVFPGTDLRLGFTLNSPA